MPPVFTRGAQTAQVAINIIVDALHEWLHGGGLSANEVRDRIASVIDADTNAAIQDAISEYHRESGD